MARRIPFHSERRQSAVTFPIHHRGDWLHRDMDRVSSAENPHRKGVTDGLGKDPGSVGIGGRLTGIPRSTNNLGHGPRYPIPKGKRPEEWGRLFVIAKRGFWRRRNIRCEVRND